MENLVTEKEVNRQTQIALPTLRRWRWQSTGLPYVKIGGRMIRYRQVDVDNFINLHRIEPEAGN